MNSLFKTQNILLMDDLRGGAKSLKPEGAGHIGGKAEGLRTVLGCGQFKVPPFFVIKAGTEFNERGAGHLLATDIATAAQLISGGSRDAKFAVRSSSLCEDQKTGSFAGQFKSFLNVDAADILSRARDVVASARANNVIQYQAMVPAGAAKTGSPARMAVLVQVMVPAEQAGVAFSINPVTGADEVVINAVDGLADDLVQGLVDGEQIVVNGTAISRGGGTALGDRHARLLADSIRDLKTKCGFAVDVEWALSQDQIYILQLRPVTTTATKPTGNVRIFDGSNIQESYPGITSPMTFSFVRRAYLEVYRSFVRLMGVKEVIISKNEDIFAGMLGFVEGRVYYNLGNWYRLMALLPAYRTNRTFMENMMGLKDPAREVSSPPEADRKPGPGARLATMVALAHILRQYFKLEGSKKQFEKRLDSILAISRNEIREMDLDSLCRLYRRLEMDLLRHWDAPIVNDFFAMIFFGIYQKLDGGSSSTTTLIEGLGNVVSAEPPRIIAEIAEQIKGDGALIASMLQNKNVDKLFPAHPRAYGQYLNYLEKFGDRSIGELKLESESVRDNPALLLSTIATVARAKSTEQSAKTARPGLKVVSAARKSPTVSNFLRATLCDIISRPTRNLIAGRENLRFARTGVFGLVRDIINTIGQRFVEQNILDSRQDIFYLEIEEVLGYIEGTSTCKNLRGLAALRRQAEKQFASSIPDRVRITGAVGAAAVFDKQVVDASIAGIAGTITGLPASSGVVSGLARVIKDPQTEHLLPGEILVAERTDPGWIMHFALCKGIVTSYGSMLSHTAIVARELKLPAVVSAKGALEQIRTGDLIEIDGAKGTVKILTVREERELQWA
ncbi:MAG: hypothetical protein JSS83_09930 [Cyanobacteria bacterium SZAS LIN-3]|nr:hypothetical protein [Cyanobacteria bacterium SZAS LIN-3]